jgi:hypothetical protein
MALHNVTESDSFDTNVQMPADGDAADSSDFESSTIRPLTNRSRWIKNKIDALLAWISGGTVNPAAPVTIDQALTVTGALVAASLATTGFIQGRRRLKVSKPTANATYAFADDRDLSYVDRTALSTGTTTITILDTGWSTGDTFSVAVRNSSSGKNVSIVVPGLGTIATGDTDQIFYSFVRLGTGDWDVYLANI